MPAILAPGIILIFFWQKIFWQKIKTVRTMQLFCASQMRTALPYTVTADHWIYIIDHLNFKSEGEMFVWIWAKLQAFCFHQSKVCSTLTALMLWWSSISQEMDTCDCALSLAPDFQGTVLFRVCIIKSIARFA